MTRPGRLRADGLGPHPRRARGHLHGREPGGGRRRRARRRRPVRRLREGGARADAGHRPRRAHHPDPQRPQPRHPLGRWTTTPSSRCPAWSTPTARTRSPSTRCPTTPPAWSARSRRSSARCSPPPSRGSRATAVKAFALHPLVDSVNVARRRRRLHGRPPRSGVPGPLARGVGIAAGSSPVTAADRPELPRSRAPPAASPVAVRHQEHVVRGLIHPGEDFFEKIPEARRLAMQRPVGRYCSAPDAARGSTGVACAGRASSVPVTAGEPVRCRGTGTVTGRSGRGPDTTV